jgi:hypothetical protein
MPFEGFLDDLRARPLRLRLLGYLASFTLHMPPLTVFAVAWLTQELVLDHALDLPDVQQVPRLVYYEVPAHFVAGLPDGVALAQASGGTAQPTSGARGARHGKAGAGKRRSRRPLEFNPMHHKAHGPVPLHVPAIGPEESGHDDGSGTGLVIRTGASDEGDGQAAGGRTFGAGDGAGHGDAERGTGGGMRGLQGPGQSAAAVGLWIPPELHKKEGRAKKENEGRNDDGEVLPDGVEDGDDDVAVVGLPLEGRPTRVSMNYAAYLRTFDPLPTLPDSCWPPGRQTNAVLLEVCVSERGDVKDVVIRQSAGDEVDSYLRDSVRTWRYRPRSVQGTAMPFCHPIRLVYTRMQRWDRRW